MRRRSRYDEHAYLPSHKRNRSQVLMHNLSSIGPQHSSALRRHFCIVTETYAPEINGVALTLERLANGLIARGHCVSVVCPRQPQIDRPNTGCGPLFTLARGLPLPGYPGLRFGLPAGKLLRTQWRQRRPDAVYVATEGPLGWSAMQTARLLRIPVISGFHTNFDRYVQYYGAGCLQGLIARYLRAFHNRTLCTLTPSADLRQRLLGLGVKEAQVLSRGVDCQRFDPARRSAELRAQWGVANCDLAALYVGRVAPEKNLQLAVDAYRAMQRIAATAKLVIVGDGPLRKTLQKAHPDLIYCGVQTGEPLAEHYASADVFLFPSETETFGNVTLEAMASGLAVVAYDYAAARMHIADGETGALAPYGDAHVFVDAAARLARDERLRQQLRRQARAYATHIDWRRVVERFEDLLTSVSPRQASPHAWRVAALAHDPDASFTYEHRQEDAC